MDNTDITDKIDNMDNVGLTPQEAARGAIRAGLPLGSDRHEAVASTAGHIHSVIATLRELDFGDTPPAMSYTAGQEDADAAL